MRHRHWIAHLRRSKQKASGSRSATLPLCPHSFRLTGEGRYCPRVGSSPGSRYCPRDRYCPRCPRCPRGVPGELPEATSASHRAAVTAHATVTAHAGATRVCDGSNLRNVQKCRGLARAAAIFKWGGGARVLPLVVHQNYYYYYYYTDPPRLSTSVTPSFFGNVGYTS